MAEGMRQVDHLEARLLRPPIHTSNSADLFETGLFQGCAYSQNLRRMDEQDGAIGSNLCIDDCVGQLARDYLGVFVFGNNVRQHAESPLRAAAVSVLRWTSRARLSSKCRKIRTAPGL